MKIAEDANTLLNRNSGKTGHRAPEWSRRQSTSLLSTLKFINKLRIRGGDQPNASETLRIPRNELGYSNMLIRESAIGAEELLRDQVHGLCEKHLRG